MLKYIWKTKYIRTNVAKYFSSILMRNQQRSKCENTEGEGIILQIKKSVAIQVIMKRH